MVLTTGIDAPVDLEMDKRLGVREIIRNQRTSDQFLDALFRHASS